MQQFIVEVENLFKEYKGGLRAVDGLSFGVRRGICFGLLGPNGAGKTTTIEIMEGVLEPTGGRVLYKGQPIGGKYRDEIGIQFQQTSLQDHLTVREVLKLFASLYPKRVDLDLLIEQCHLSEFLNREPRKLSGGQRQRVLLAIALVNDPEVVFLDEPTTGLDPQARRHFWELVEGIKARGKTLILTTHYMDEAYVLCDEIAIVDQGKLIEQGAPTELLEKHFSGSMIELPVSAVSAEALAQLGLAFKKVGERWEIQSRLINESLAQLMATSTALSGLTVKAPTLEDLFLKLTGKRLRA